MNRDWVDDFGVVVVVVVVGFGFAEFTIGPPRGAVAAALFRPITRFESKAGR